MLHMWPSATILIPIYIHTNILLKNHVLCSHMMCLCNPPYFPGVSFLPIVKNLRVLVLFHTNIARKVCMESTYC